MRRTIASAVGAFVVAAGAFTTVLSGPAHAVAETCDASRTVTTHLVNRPDHGHGHGGNSSYGGDVWALVTVDRTVTITVKEKTENSPTWSYRAVVTDHGVNNTDKGTLKTLGGAHLSPNAGEALTADREGTVFGGLTVDFKAAPCFGGYQGNLDGDTVTGDEGPTTSGWVEAVWGCKIDSPVTVTYTWTYATCSEQWTDADNNDDGQTPGAGDITGKACPPPPTPSSPASSAPAPGNGGGGVANPPAAAPALPVTGSNPMLFLGIGVAAMILGVAAIVFTRRRKFTA